eukprot:3306586-Pleurochrysis_carterae.AAC.1
MPCTPEASASTQGIFVAALPFVLARAQVAAAAFEREWPSLSVVPAMAGMCVGWACGAFGTQLLVELEAATACEGCHVLRVSFSLGCTLMTAAATLALQPPALQPPARSTHSCAARCTLHPVLTVAWTLILRAISVRTGRNLNFVKSE